MSQTIQDQPLPPLEQIQHVLDTLFTSGDANLQNEANRWLLELQSHPHIAMVCLDLIKNDRSYYSQIYGIQTLHSKIHQDWESRWNEEFRSQVRTILFSKFLTDDNNLNQLIYSKICLCIAAIMIHSIPKLWEHPIGDLVALLGSNQTSERVKKGAIDILTVLPQEFGNVVLSNARCLAVKEYFIQRSEPVIYLLSSSLEHSDRPTKLLILKCISYWIDYTNSKVVETGNVLNNIFQAIEDDELFPEGISLLNDMINFHTYRSPFSEKEPANATNIHSSDELNFRKLIIPIINKLVSKKDLYVRSEKNDNIVICRSFAEIFSQIVECYTPIMLQVDRKEVQMVIEFLMEICSHKEKELSELTFDAWIYMGEHIVSMDPDAISDSYQNLYAHLLTKILQKSSFPTNVEKVDFNSELATDISAYRANAGDIVLSCFEIIQPQVFFIYIENILKNNCNNWQSFEVVIYLFRCVHSEVYEDDQGAANIISHILTLPAHPTLSISILLMIQEYGDYIYKSEDLLNPAFSYILSLIPNNDVRVVALKTLRIYSQAYGDRLYQNIDNSMTIWENNLTSFSIDEQKDFIESILFLSSYTTEDKIPTILQKTLTPVIVQLKNALAFNAPPLQKSVLIIERLSLLQSSLKIPDDYMSIFKDYVNNIWPLCVGAHQYSKEHHDSNVSEALWKVLWKIMKEMGNEEFNLEQIFGFILQDISTLSTISHSCVETINLLTKNFSSNQKYQNHFTSLVNQLSLKSLPLISLQNNDSMTVISRFYSIMANVLQYNPQIFYNIPQVVNIVELAIVAITNTEKDSVMRVMEFLNLLFIQSNSVQETLSKQYASHILKNILQAIVQDRFKHMTAYFANLLRQWIDKYKEEPTPSIIREIFSNANWIPTEVSKEERDRIARLIIGISNPHRFKVLVSDLIDACNRFQTWDVFLSFEI